MPRCMFGYGRRIGPGRPPKRRIVNFNIAASRFIPLVNGVLKENAEAIVLLPDELEALRLVDYLGLMQGEAAKRMGVSRGTVWRLIESGRRKIVTALLKGNLIEILPPKE